MKAPIVEYQQRKKMKGKGGSVNAHRAKKIVRDQTKKQFLQTIKGVKQQILDDHTVKSETSAPIKRQALDRFKPKKKK